MKDKKLKITLSVPANRGTASDDIQTVQQLLHNMDWNLLKAQKKVLLKLQSKKSTNNAEHEALEGTINFIDLIQDIAVDRYGYDEELVFNREGKMKLKEAKEICIKG